MSSGRTPVELFRSLWDAGVDVVFPKRCVGCGRFGALICPGCATGLESAIGEGRCSVCSARWMGEGNCPRCFHWSALDGAFAVYEMAGVARDLVHELKYRRVRDAAKPMASDMAQLRDLHPFDLALAIPLHHSRQKDRGFNQAEQLLRQLGWPTEKRSLRRSRRTNQQVGKHLKERRRNVNGAFVYEGPRLDGKTIAVIDDVVTTGATGDECAKILKDAGARTVIALSYARASYDSKREGRIREDE